MNYILYHHGVKGMRWGHRKKPQVSKFASYGVKGGPNGGPKVSKFTSYGVKGGPTSEYAKERKRQKKLLATKRGIKAGVYFANRFLTANNSSLRVGNDSVAFVNTFLNYKYAHDTLNK